MGFEPGGRADKLGNRYEGRWVAKQLLRLLKEEIRSVTLEAIGDDEKGVDLWIELKSGKRQAHQTVVATLLTYAENHDQLGNPICADELLKYLETQDIHPKNLAHDDRVTPAIECRRREFEESIYPRLIDSQLIPREESDECFKTLKNNGMVILHGAAGSGKSGVLYELTQKLRDEKIPCLPLRLD